MTRAFWMVASIVLVFLPGCLAPITDYSSYLAHLPASILVIPPLNESVEVRAPDSFLSTITAPLAECGYYVFPIAVVDQMFKENGVPTPGEMHQVSLEKLGEVFGADAVLYITIKKWTTTYIVIDSTTVVTLEYRLVDIGTGATLFVRRGSMSYSSSQGQNNIVGMLFAAQVHAAMSTTGLYELNCARNVNWQVCGDRLHGFLLGCRHPRFAEDQAQVLKRQEELKRRAEKAK